MENELRKVQQSLLGQPDGLMVTSDGYLWVSDSKNNRLLRYPLPDRSGANAPIIQILPDDQGEELGAMDEAPPADSTPSPTEEASPTADEAASPTPSITIDAT